MSKKIVGVDIGSYSFDATNKQIILNEIPTLSLENILIITNVTDGIQIYNFADNNLNATISNNIITLEYDTTSMSNSDNIQIFIEDGDVSNDTTSILEYLACLGQCMKRLLTNISYPAWLDRALNRLRVTGILESGTLTTLTTCSTVTNISNIGGYPAQSIMETSLKNTWMTGVRSKIVN